MDSVLQVTEFIRDRIVVHPGGIITVTDAYAEFKVWSRDCYPGKSIINRSTFRNMLSVPLGSSYRGGWIGARLVYR